MNAPKPNTTWLHTGGDIYKVLLVTNYSSNRQEEYPSTVVYGRLKDKTIWSRPLSKWYDSFKLIEQKQG